jgi:solute carrier family 25 phosphate transporter 23/24/25/41
MTTYPLDIARTRLSILGATATESLAAVKKQPSIASVVASIYRNEGGFLALYRGLMPTLWGVAPYVALVRVNLR